METKFGVRWPGAALVFKPLGDSQPAMQRCSEGPPWRWRRVRADADDPVLAHSRERHGGRSLQIINLAVLRNDLKSKAVPGHRIPNGRSLRFIFPFAAIALYSTFSFAQEARYIGGEAATGSSRAVVAPEGAIVTTGQVMPVAPSGDIADSPSRQIEQALDNLDRGLKAVDSGLEKVVRLNVYVARAEKRTLVQEALARRFTGEYRPSMTFAVTPFADSRVLVALDAVAMTKASPAKATRSPVAAGRFAYTVCPPGGRIYIAGQAESGADLAEATRKTLASLRSTLAWLGRDDEDILALKAFVAPAAEGETVHKEIVAFSLKK